VILQMISLGLGDPRQFPFLDPPSVQAIRDGYRLLLELGAITAENRLTQRGRIMAGLPLDPCIARIIVEAAHLGALREIKIIAAGLSIQDPRIRPAENEAKADAAHRAFADPKSDFLTLLHIWDTYQAAAGKVRSKARLRKFCTTHFLSWQRMREWLDIFDQISVLTRHHPNFTDNKEPASFAAVHQSLLSGFLRNIAQKKEKNLYLISGGREVMLFPGSALYNHGGAWMVCASFMETGRLFAMSAATVDVRWLEQIGGALCRRSWSDPHWEKKAGQVIALEKVTLFGLVIVAGRRINFGRVGPAAAKEARTIFIRDALAGGELGANFPFLRHNLELISQYREMEERTRRRNILVDEQALFNFYDQRLGPAWDRHTLQQDIRGHHGDRYLRMELADICLAAPAAEELYLFPEILPIGGHNIALSYRFEPGHEEDGVTATLPLALLDSLSPAVFEWLVPGLLEEKIAGLLRSLPKTLRRHLVPLPDSTARILDQLELYQGSLYAALERIIFKLYQVRIARTDWQPEKLGPHLRMRFALIDAQDHLLYAGRSFQQLSTLSRRAKTEPETGGGGRPPAAPPPLALSTWDFATPPGPVPIQDDPAAGGFLHPALFVDAQHQSAELRYIPDLAESRRRNRSGLRFLATREFPQEVNVLARECKGAVTSHFASWLALETALPATELRQRLLDFLLDHLFAIPPTTLPSASEFTAALATAKSCGVARAGRQMLDHLLQLLALRREMRNRLLPEAGKPGREKTLPAEMRSEMQGLLEHLLPSNFLDTRRYADLVHTDRYLKALAVRIDRAVLAPGKDLRKAEQIAPALRPLAKFAEPDSLSSECRTCLAEYRLLVEELRVSVFAPELGTAQPVSLKRLREKWQEVENVCLQVE
jgi:ATP-dependent helicase HrpA